MSGDEYLKSIIAKYKQSNLYSQSERNVYVTVCSWIKTWFGNFQKNYWQAQYVSMETQQSGSRAKGTAIKGKSDIDIFVSFWDPNGYFKLKDLYDSLYNYLRAVFKNARKQNVSIGIEFNGFDIDVVPARKVNSTSYEVNLQRYNDHYLWSNKRQNRMLTNIQKHIDLVRNSGIIDEIVLFKVWKRQKGIDFPSIYLELFLIDAFQNYRYGTIGQRIDYAFKYIRDNIESKRVVDPSNSSNILSDDLTLAEKRVIKKAAQEAIDAQYWSQVVK